VRGWWEASGNLPTMMVSPRKTVAKRIGGAPFSSPRLQRSKDPFSFPSAQSQQRVTSQLDGSPLVVPSSARGRLQVAPAAAAAAAAHVVAVSLGAAHKVQDGGSSGSRCRSLDDRHSQVSTPCTERAARYVDRLAGNAVSGAQTAREGALEWTLVQELDTVDHINRERARRNQDRQRRRENLEQLRVQQEDQQRAKAECKQLWRRWRDEVEEDVEKFKKEEEQKRQSALEVRRRFDEDRKKQVEAVHQKKKAQYEAEERETRDMIVAMQEAKRREEEKEERRRQTERVAATAMAEEAKQARVRKMELKHAEAEYDKVMAKKQRELLDRQQRVREEERAERLDKQDKLLKQYEAGVGNELERKQREDEERAVKQQKALADKERRQAAEKEQRLKDMREAGKVAVAQQLEEHARVRQQRRDEEMEFHERLLRESQAADAKEKEKQERRRAAREANAEELRQQIRERAAIEPLQVQRDQMNEVERAMNRQKLERARDAERPDGYKLIVNKKRSEYRAANSAR